jgi:hypothetical protein
LTDGDIALVCVRVKAQQLGLGCPLLHGAARSRVGRRRKPDAGEAGHLSEQAFPLTRE